MSEKIPQPTVTLAELETELLQLQFEEKTIFKRLVELREIHPTASTQELEDQLFRLRERDDALTRQIESLKLSQPQDTPVVDVLDTPEDYTSPENPFAKIEQSQILKLRTIMQEVPFLYKLYKAYTDIETARGKTVHRRDALWHVYTTLRRGKPDDIQMAAMLLATPTYCDITPQTTLRLKTVINGIPGLKKIHDEVYTEIIEERRQNKTLVTTHGYPSIKNIDIVRALVQKLQQKPDTDTQAKAFLHILSFYATV